MYPDAMKNAVHPTGRAYACVSAPKLIGDCMLKGFKCPFFFIQVIGKNHGAQISVSLTVDKDAFVFSEDFYFLLYNY
jgi:hypothetical protein